MAHFSSMFEPPSAQRGSAGAHGGEKPPMPLVGRLVLVVFVVSFVGADPRTGGLETQ